jgi:hypothetical protein
MLKLSDELLFHLDKAAGSSYTTRSALIRRAIVELLNREYPRKQVHTSFEPTDTEDDDILDPRMPWQKPPYV